MQHSCLIVDRSNNTVRIRTPARELLFLLLLLPLLDVLLVPPSFALVPAPVSSLVKTPLRVVEGRTFLSFPPSSVNRRLPLIKNHPMSVTGRRPSYVSLTSLNGMRSLQMLSPLLPFLLAVIDLPHPSPCVPRCFLSCVCLECAVGSTDVTYASLSFAHIFHFFFPSAHANTLSCSLPCLIPIQGLE